MNEDPLLDVTNSVAIQRLVEEVRNADHPPHGYNRTYSRHNRSFPWLPPNEPPEPPAPPSEPAP